MLGLQEVPIWECVARLGVGGPISWLNSHTPSSALILAFQGARQKQEGQRRKLEQQVALMEARQAEELAVLETTARNLERPSQPRPPPPPGETFL